MDLQLRVVFHLIAYPKIANAQLPGGERIRAHRFPITCFEQRFVGEPLIDGVQDDSPLPRGQRLQGAPMSGEYSIR